MSRPVQYKASSLAWGLWFCLPEHHLFTPVYGFVWDGPSMTQHPWVERVTRPRLTQLYSYVGCI